MYHILLDTTLLVLIYEEDNKVHIYEVEGDFSDVTLDDIDLGYDVKELLDELLGEDNYDASHGVSNKERFKLFLKGYLISEELEMTPTEFLDSDLAWDFIENELNADGLQFSLVNDLNEDTDKEQKEWTKESKEAISFTQSHYVLGEVKDVPRFW